jgi:hypothetical protein
MNKGAMIKYQLSQELKIYKKSVQQSSCLASTLEEAILGLDEDMFPTLSQLALIHYTLPVSVASAERSFSTLKILKTYLRNRMAEERLVGISIKNLKCLKCKKNYYFSMYMKTNL